MDKATPRPWYAIGNYIHADSGQTIAHTYEPTARPQNENKANAELIVKAVNEYDQKFKISTREWNAIASILDSIEDHMSHSGSKIYDGDIKAVRKLLQRAKAAK